LPKITDLTPPGHKPQSLVLLLRERRDGQNSQYYARRLVELRLRKTPRNPYSTKALGAVSLERAKELAWQWWTGGEPQIHGKGSPDGYRFEKIARSYLADLKTKQEAVHYAHPAAVSLKKYARHDQSIRLHLNPFFGSMGIENIGPEDVERWLEWRRSPRATDEDEDQDRTDLATEAKHTHRRPDPPCRRTRLRLQPLSAMPGCNSKWIRGSFPSFRYRLKRKTHVGPGSIRTNSSVFHKHCMTGWFRARENGDH
jgi:hypothetical protein